jgi:hypothetical protein
VVLRPADDTIARKVNASDASAFAKICGCFPSQGKPNNALFERVHIDRWHPFSQISKNKVWGVIWLIVAFIFFISGVLVGIVAFKVCYSRKQILRYILSWGCYSYVCFVGIGGSAKRRCEALFARSRVERRNSNVAIDTACTITQHLVICITRFAMIISIASCAARRYPVRERARITV